MSLEEVMQVQMQETKVRDDLTIVELGTLDYHSALDMQEKLVVLRNQNKITDTVLLLEHPHVYTLGRDVKDEELGKLVRGELPAEIIQVQRGGKITYHGPGQLVAYFICRLPFVKYGTFLAQVEDVGIATLKSLGIDAYSRKQDIDPRSNKRGIKGAWYKVEGVDRKVVAQGVEVRESPRQANERMVVTLHGFAMNVNTDLAFFQKIHPCGFQYDVMSSMKEILGREIDMKQVKEAVKEQLKDKLKW